MLTLTHDAYSYSGCGCLEHPTGAAVVLFGGPTPVFPFSEFRSVLKTLFESSSVEVAHTPGKEHTLPRMAEVSSNLLSPRKGLEMSLSPLLSENGQRDPATAGRNTYDPPPRNPAKGRTLVRAIPRSIPNRAMRVIVAGLVIALASE